MNPHSRGHETNHDRAGSAVWDQIHGALAPADEARSAELWDLIRRGGRCACGRKLNDTSAGMHPGVCRECLRAARRKGEG